MFWGKNAIPLPLPAAAVPRAGLSQSLRLRPKRRRKSRAQLLRWLPLRSRAAAARPGLFLIPRRTKCDSLWHSRRFGSGSTCASTTGMRIIRERFSHCHGVLHADFNAMSRVHRYAYGYALPYRGSRERQRFLVLRNGQGYGRLDKIMFSKVPKKRCHWRTGFDEKYQYII